MIIREIAVVILLLTTSCGAAPTNDAKLNGDTPIDVGKEEIAQQKRSIEEAAEEATKLIEADAKAEVDAAAEERKNS